MTGDCVQDDWDFREDLLVFDGEQQPLIAELNPVAHCPAFTIEALFRPRAGGGDEQRFVHVQAAGSDSRALLELRSTPQGWYADVFVKVAAGERFLNDPPLLHPFGQWHTLALVYTGSQLRQAVNGRIELVGEAPRGTIGPGRLALGWRINRVSPFFGEIALVRFSTWALAPEELLRPGEFPGF